MAKPPRIAVYVRISDDEEGSGAGVARQRRDCLLRADRERWHVVEVYEENDVGASRHSKKPRPKYRQMIESAERGELDVILAYSNSRLTRRPMELEELIDLHDRQGVQVRTIVSGDDDLATADGRMVARIKASVDAAEADRISERVKRQVASKVERGEWLGGPRPFGWGWSERIDGRRVDRDTNKLNEVESQMIRDGAEHVLAGGSVGALIRAWNASGVTTARGAGWRHVTVNRVLTRWRNAGVYEHRGTPRPEVSTSWAPILTIAQVEALRAILSDEKRGRASGYAPKHLMSGIARCGREGCGHVLKSGAVRSRGKAYPMYRCSGPGCGLAIDMSTLNHAVSRRMIEVYVLDAPAKVEAAQEQTHNALKSAHLALAAVLSEQTECTALINDGLASPAQLRPKLVELHEREAQLRADIARVHREDAHAAMNAATLSAFDLRDGKVKLPFDFLERITPKWEAMELDARRRLIRAMVTVEVLPAKGRKRADRIVIEPAR